MTNFMDKISDYEFEIKVTDIVLSLGIPANIKGFTYIREALLVCIVEPDKVTYVTKCLYPELASKFKTTPSRVERAIRHAIERSWSIKDGTRMGEYFYLGDRKRPTNSEFLAVMSEKIRMELRLKQSEEAL